MKKKLCIAGLLGIAICVLYACVRDGSPAPEPSGPSLRKAQGYFENRIEELKLPNPRFNLPGGNPVTKSGVPFDLLLGEGIHPLWEYARGYTCGELNIVEIPVSRSNHIRYSIYITEDGTEIRDVSEADTRLIVIEDMEHESMSSFLVTLLPSSDYEKGTRNLPYVLIDTDFSGISIYSDPSGAPTFGRYFVDGKEEYGFRFPENEEEFLPESFLRIGILWSEGNTRGIHDTNDMDPVGVSATLPFSPPEYEGFNFCIVCHHTTCICSPLKFQLHDLEGGGTGSIPIREPEPEPDSILLKDEMTKQKISPLLKEIDQDCLGQVLISHASLYGVTISYDKDVPWGVTETVSGNIRWGDEGAINFVIYEELFHSYQIKSGGFDRNYRGSMEIEAKVAVWKYMDRTRQKFNIQEDAWDLIGIFAKNPTSDNYKHAITGIAKMGYWEPSYMINHDLYTLSNYNKINPCND